MKPLLVGEANPYQADPRLAQRYALYPDPPGCAGHRLCYRVMGLTSVEYLKRFDRVNLCDGKWSVKEARQRALWLLQWRTAADVIVLFGKKVTDCFHVSFETFTIRTHHGVGDAKLVILPHPSGLSRAWNEPGAFERARTVLREAGVL